MLPVRAQDKAGSGSAGWQLHSSLTIMFLLFVITQLVGFMSLSLLIGVDPETTLKLTAAAQGGAPTVRVSVAKGLGSGSGLDSEDMEIAAGSIAASSLVMPRQAPALPQLSPQQQASVIEYLMEKYRATTKEVKRLVTSIQKSGGSEAALTATAPPQPDYTQLTPRACSNAMSLKVATYNLWNVNQPWPVRRDAIAKILASLTPDIVGLQEVRFQDGISQVEALAKLPILQALGYQYAYIKVQDMDVGQEEGLGILSRHPIASTSSFSFTPLTAPPDDGDAVSVPANRVCFQALVNTSTIGPVNFFVTHWSVNDYEQCRSAVQLMQQLNTDSFDRTIPQVLVGDFNAYFDFEWAMDFLTQRSPEFVLSPQNPCSRFFYEYSWPSNFAPWRDPWQSLHANEPGHTFPNFQGSRILDASRADRVLFRHHSSENPADLSTSLIECSSGVFGGPEAGWRQDGSPMYPSDHRGVLASLVWDPRPDVPYPRKLAELQALAAPRSSAQTPSSPASQQTAPSGVGVSDSRPTASTPTQSAPSQSVPAGSAQTGAAPMVPPSSTQLDIPDMPPVSRGSHSASNLFRPASVLCSMLDYTVADDGQNHACEAAFDGNVNTYFWSDREVKVGDHLTVILNTPERFSTVTALTGHPPVAGRENEPLRDMMVSGVLELAFVTVGGMGARSVTPFTVAAVFNKGIASANLEALYPDKLSVLHSVRIKATQSVDTWFAVREIVLQ